VVIDAAVIELYYAGIQARPIRQQQVFVAVWDVMKRIRQARRRA
jgi:hypothetical protein